MRKTKIICTLGQSVSTNLLKVEVVGELFK